MAISMSEFIKKAKSNKVVVASWIWLVVGFVVNLRDAFGPGKYLINSDMAAEMMMADIANKEHTIIASNWYYANEIRTFSIQWFYRVWLLIFPNNWHLARGFSLATMLLVLIAVSLYFYKQIGAEKIGVWATGFLIWPFGMWHYYYMVRNSYYVCFYITAFVAAATVIQFAKAGKKNIPAIIALILSALYSFFTGLNGVRELMLAYFPLTLATVIFVLLPMFSRESQTVKEYVTTNRIRFRVLGAVLTILAANVLGYGFYQYVLIKKYWVANELDGLAWGNCYNSLHNILQDYLSLFGFQYSTTVLTLRGVLGAFGILLMLIVMIAVVRVAFHYKRLSIWEQYIYMLYVVSMLIQIIVYMYMGAYAIPYWLPMIPLTIAVIAIEIKNENISIANGRVWLGIIISVAVTITSACNIKAGIGSQISPVYGGDPGFENVVKWLEQNDYNRGVASFWNSNVITELTNGKVEMWAVASMVDTEASQWLQPKNHTSIPENDYFILVYQGADIGADVIQNRADATIVYADNTYVIYYVK